MRRKGLTSTDSPEMAEGAKGVSGAKGAGVAGVVSGAGGAKGAGSTRLIAIHRLERWFAERGWTPFEFQKQAWEAALDGHDGMLLAPTGSGKTWALLGPTLLAEMIRRPSAGDKDDGAGSDSIANADITANAHAAATAAAAADAAYATAPDGLRLIWITPLRALAKDLERNMQEAVQGLGLGLTVQRRTGDLSESERSRQNKAFPSILITTPESLHILFAGKDHGRHLRTLETVVVDEWHEFLGSKRGTQTELALARLKTLRRDLRIWGVSATIGNIGEARDVLFGDVNRAARAVMIKAEVHKAVEIRSILPDRIEEFPWSGHLGLALLPKLLPLLDPPGSVLIFTNTRAQSEIWFRSLLEAKPELAGEVAIHHGSLTREIRTWVEEALREGIVRVVVCTSSLDLGVDFSPVDRVVQIGSPKGIARFLQRAGRSGHAPGQTSRIHFLPTHALELLEASALRTAAERGDLEQRQPLISPIDVLIQYVVTMAVGDGFKAEELYREILSTWAYRHLSRRDWSRILEFVTQGGASLQRYPEYRKVEVDEDGIHRVLQRSIARRHRLSIGTIASDSMMRVKFLSGGSLGTVEEWFVSRLEPGDRFWFAGRLLELVRVHQMTALVKKASSGPSVTPSWQGGRMSLSSNLSQGLQETLRTAASGDRTDPESALLRPLLDIQRRWSIVPDDDRFLIECSRSREGFHTFFYPFEGRNVHTGLAALVAARMARTRRITFTMAMNDYGFELLSDQQVEWDEPLIRRLFSPEGLVEDLSRSANASELAKRQFREICRVAGLVFQGYPGQHKADRHLMFSSSLFYDVFSEFEPDHLLLRQAVDEVLQLQLEETRIRKVLQRLAGQTIHLVETPRFSPFAFPIFVDRLREKVSSETLADRIRRMQSQVAGEFDRP